MAALLKVTALPEFPWRNSNTSDKHNFLKITFTSFYDPGLRLCRHVFPFFCLLVLDLTDSPAYPLHAPTVVSWAGRPSPDRSHMISGQHDRTRYPKVILLLLSDILLYYETGLIFYLPHVLGQNPTRIIFGHIYMRVFFTVVDLLASVVGTVPYIGGVGFSLFSGWARHQPSSLLGVLGKFLPGATNGYTTASLC